MKTCHRLSVVVLVITCWPPIARPADPQKSSPTYALTLPPLEILDRLGALNLGPAPKLSADERAFLEKVWTFRNQGAGAKLDESLLLDAMLFASGVEDAAVQQRYRQQYLEIVSKAKESL